MMLHASSAAPASYGAHMIAWQLQQASAQLQQLKLLLQVAQEQLADSSQLNAMLQWDVSTLRIMPDAEATTTAAHDPAGSAAADMVLRLLVTEDSTPQQQSSSSSSSAVPLAAPAQPAPARGVPPPRPPPGSPPPAVVRAVLPPRPPPLLHPAVVRLVPPPRPPPTQPPPSSSSAGAAAPVFEESLAYILQLQRGLWTTDECRRRSRTGADVRLYRLLPSSLQPAGALGPPHPHDLYSYLCLKEAIRACTACRNCRDKIIRHAKRLDALHLPAFNPLVLVHSEVLAAIRAQSARATSAPGSERRSLADLGVGSLTRLALALQAAMQHAPNTEFFQGGSSDSF